MMVSDLDSHYIVEGDDVFVYTSPVLRRTRRALGQRGPGNSDRFFNIRVPDPPGEHHDRRGDDEFLMDVENNPGPTLTRNQKRQQNRKNQQKAKETDKETIAKLQADLDFEKERHKEAEEKHFEPLTELKEKADMLVAEQNLRQADLENENSINAITFPEVIPNPRPYAGLYVEGDKRKGIFIVDVPESRVPGLRNVWTRVLIAIIIIITFVWMSLTFFDVYLGVFRTYDEMILHDDLLETVNVIWFCWICVYPPLCAIIAIYFAKARPTAIRLVGVPWHVTDLQRDDRPEFDRGDKLAPQKLVDYKLFVEVVFGHHYAYYDSRHDVDLPNYWFDGVSSTANLKTLHLNVGLMASALNRKTLALRGGGAKDAARVERSFRLVSSNAAYQEDYDKLMYDGTSSYSDMQLFAGTILTGDATVNPTAFC